VVADVFFLSKKVYGTEKPKTNSRKMQQTCKERLEPQTLHLLTKYILNTKKAKGKQDRN